MPRTPSYGGGTSNMTMSSEWSARTPLMSPACTAAAQFSINVRICSSSSAMFGPVPSTAPLRMRLGSDLRLVDEAVRVAGGVAALEAGLVDPPSAEVVAVREELRVHGHAAGLGVRVDTGHPGAYAVRVEDVVPRRVERVREVHAPTVSAHLHHLGRARQPQLGGCRVRGSVDDPAEAHRSRLSRVVRIAHVVLLELPRPPARDVQPAVVDGQVDVAHQRRYSAEGLKRGGEVGGFGRLGGGGGYPLFPPAGGLPGAPPPPRGGGRHPQNPPHQ